MSLTNAMINASQSRALELKDIQKIINEHNTLINMDDLCAICVHPRLHTYYAYVLSVAVMQSDMSNFLPQHPVPDKIYRDVINAMIVKSTYA